jgi:hypothetical protein
LQKKEHANGTMSNNFLDIPSVPNIGQKFGLKFINNEETEPVPEERHGIDFNLNELSRQILSKTDVPHTANNAPSTDSLPIPGFVIKSSISSSDNAKSFPAGLKLFINVCWSDNVPEPAGGIDAQSAPIIADLIRRGGNFTIPMLFYDDEHWETDKSGKRSLVYDCCVNTNVYRTAIGNDTLKIYLIECILQMMEGKASLELTRRT